MYIIHRIEALHTAAFVKKKTDNSKLLMTVICQIYSMQLEKEFKSAQL